MVHICTLSSYFSVENYEKYTGNILGILENYDTLLVVTLIYMCCYYMIKEVSLYILESPIISCKPFCGAYLLGCLSVGMFFSVVLIYGKC